MADWHLAELDQALTQAGWKIVNQLPGDERSISATWVIQRSMQQQALLIDFDGMSDMECLPLSRSYACKLRNHSGVNLYFGKKSVYWTQQLQEFVGVLNHLNSEKGS